MPALLKVGVIGTGALGKEHARIYGELQREGLIEFAGVYDASREAARAVAEKVGTRPFDSIEAALAQTDALSVVTPTITHLRPCAPISAGGPPCPCRKAMTETSAQAAELVQLASANSCIPRSATSNVSIPFSLICRRQLRTRVSLKPTGSPLSRSQHRHRGRAGF